MNKKQTQSIGRCVQILTFAALLLTGTVGAKAQLPLSPWAETTNIAVILPFNLASTSMREDKLQMRSVEFYQGVLLAVEQAQRMGRHVNLLTYDTGSRTIADILADEKLSLAQMIVTPIDAENAREVALYGEVKGIPVVSPFAFCADLVNTCPHFYQMNASKSVFYPELNEELKRRFYDYAFVFMSDSLYQDAPDAYAAVLKESLTASGITSYDYVYNSPESVAQMDTLLGLTQRNMLIVPATPQKEALRKLFPSLKNKLFVDSEQQTDSVRRVSVLGYPDWQRYTDDFMEYYYDLDVWMFTKFYVNPFNPDVQDFYAQFRYWFARELMPLYPKYGMLGYDVINFALHHTAPHLYRNDYGELPYTLQSALNFVQEGEGCYLNKGFYLVHFNKNADIEEYEIK